MESTIFEISDLMSICDKNLILEREIETKRSKREGESQEVYKTMKPVKQVLRVEFGGIVVREVFEKALGTIGVSYQNGISRPACDKLDKDSGFTGSAWEQWCKANPIYTIKMTESKRGNRVEIPLEQRITAMSAEQLASTFSEEQLTAILNAKRGLK